MAFILTPFLRFFGLLLLQVFILNAIEPGVGIYLMAYPLFIAILPFSYGVITVLSVSFLIGLCVDLFSNTFGLHASAAVAMGMARPLLYKYFAPRDGYDVLRQPNLLDMGIRWHLLTFGSLLFVHHFWFFTLESFRWDNIPGAFMKTLFSGSLSIVLCLIIQYLFFKKEKAR
jgi:hypothetical protein